MEERHKGASQHDLEEYIRIHRAQSRLEGMLKDIYDSARDRQDISDKGQEFYDLVSDIHAEYLLRMAEEEKETQVLF